MENIYDYIICGGGFSGLTQAYYLSKHHPEKTILIIEPRELTLSNITFSFWKDSNEKFEFEGIIHRKWDQIGFKTDSVNHINKLNKYVYCTILGNEYETYIKNILQTTKKVKFVKETVENVEDRGNDVKVKTNMNEYVGQIIFNSIYSKPKALGNAHYLTQNIGGWIIETEDKAFDSKVMTMFDFSLGNEGWDFIYVLPFSSKQALIENIALINSSEKKLEEYIEKILGIKKYEILYKEGGNTQMTNYEFTQWNGNRIINIGKAGGMVKPTIGFAFTRVHKQCDLIAKNVSDLIKLRNIAHKNRTPFIYRKADSIMLHLMEKRRGEIQNIFKEIFVKADSDLLFKFLDEKLSFREWVLFCIKLRSVLPIFIRVLFEDIRSI